MALAMGSAAAFAPAAQPRTSVVRFMDEDALKNKILNAGPAEFNKIGGVEVATEMPADIKFEVPIPAKVMGRWDGECAITVSEGEMKAGSGNSATVNVVPDSMGYEVRRGVLGIRRLRRHRRDTLPSSKAGHSPVDLHAGLVPHARRHAGRLGRRAGAHRAHGHPGRSSGPESRRTARDGQCINQIVAARLPLLNHGLNAIDDTRLTA